MERLNEYDNQTIKDKKNHKNNLVEGKVFV
jgi:hypothetical protein